MKELKMIALIGILVLASFPVILFSWAGSRRAADDVVKIEKSKVESAILCKQAGGRYFIDSEIGKSSCIFN